MGIESNINTSFKDVLLEDTGLFNYVGGQSLVYNRFKELGINTVGDIFANIKPNSFSYVKDQVYGNMSYNYGNRYVKEEINGIISLIKYKYAYEVSESLKRALETTIDMDINLDLRPAFWRYMYPGDVFKAVYQQSRLPIKEKIDLLYKLLKSCGFDLTGVKALTDIAYKNKIKDMSLGEFLCSLDEEVIRERFSKKPKELIPFLNVLEILVGFYQTYCKVDTSSHKK